MDAALVHQREVQAAHLAVRLARVVEHSTRFKFPTAATEEHGVLYTVIGTETGLKVVSKAPVGGRYTADFPLAPATAIEGKVYSKCALNSRGETGRALFL